VKGLAFLENEVERDALCRLRGRGVSVVQGIGHHDPALIGNRRLQRQKEAESNVASFATWIQTFNGENKYRNPSESELRLDVFGAWTFGAKMQSAFTYNAGSSSLFVKTFNGSGDSKLAPAYEWIKQILHESRNLSPYLVKLRCIKTAWILGKGSEYPWGVAPWKYDAEKWPELRGVVVKNLSQLKGGEPGDVAIGFFQPLAAAEQGERWIMVTNALNDRTASAAQAGQQITLNFLLKEGASLHIANRATGKLELAKLKKVGEAGRNLLELNLPGGTGELLCLKSSASR